MAEQRKEAIVIRETKEVFADGPHSLIGFAFFLPEEEIVLSLRLVIVAMTWIAIIQMQKGRQEVGFSSMTGIWKG